MKLNRKAIMVDFLVTVLLAIIIFAPACYISSTFFRLSDQAKESFTNFIGTAQKISETGKEGEPKSEFLVLDKETAIVFFEPKYSEVEVIFGGEKYLFNRPSQCQLDQNCVCLFREVDEENNIFSAVKKTCYPLNFQLKMEDCTPAGSEEAVTCSHGFFIGREISDFEGLRKTGFTLKKEGNTILLVK